jgi:hypothetical protein
MEGDGRDMGPPHPLLVWGGRDTGLGNHSTSFAGASATGPADPGGPAAGSPLISKISLNYKLWRVIALAIPDRRRPENRLIAGCLIRVSL